MSDVELQIIVPAGADKTDPLDHGLVALTEAICQATGEESGFGLGGQFGYGENYENGVFVMRRFYWGDCTCGANARGEKWHTENPHASDCFRTELHTQFDKYDEESGYNAADAACHAPGNVLERMEQTEFGSMTSTERTANGEAAHEIWCKAHDKRNKEHSRLTKSLYLKRGLIPSPYQWLCTCGVDERAKTYFATEGHYADCQLELPNFKHKRTGFEVRWYKWIGRDMETRGPNEVDLQAVFAECLASLPARVLVTGEQGT